MNLFSSWKCFYLSLSLCTFCSCFLESAHPHPSPTFSSPYVWLGNCYSHLRSPLKAAAALRVLSTHPRLWLLTVFSVSHCTLLRLHFGAHPCLHLCKLPLITRWLATRNRRPYHFIFVSQKLAQCLSWVFNKKCDGWMSEWSAIRQDFKKGTTRRIIVFYNQHSSVESKLNYLADRCLYTSWSFISWLI